MNVEDEAADARKLLVAAIGARLIAPDELATRAAQDPLRGLHAVRASTSWAPRVEAALGRLARASEPAAEGVPVPGGTLSPERVAPPGAVPGGGTLSPERAASPGAVPGGGTLSPERAASPEAVPHGGTLSPERAPLSTGTVPLRGGTLSPERAAPSTGTAPLRGGTLSPERAAPSTGTAPLRGGTLSPERAAPSTGPVPVVGGTLSPERAAPQVIERRATSSSAREALARAATVEPTAAAPIDRTSALAAAQRWVVDLDALGDEDRRVLERAVFLAVVRRRGWVTAEVALELADDPSPEDRLVERGVLAAEVAVDVYAALQTPQAVCVPCLGLLARHDAACGTCRPSSSRTGSRGTFIAYAGEIDERALTEGSGMFGDYELLGRVAEGGMGVVFKARDLSLQRVVALKVMRGGVLASSTRRLRFLHEAEAAAALHHPNIVPIHHIGELKGYPFYTMDFIEGPPLDRWVAERGIAPVDVARLVGTLADAVHHFHLRGIIHRDLKPDNVLVTADGQPKVIDFGIARKVSDVHDSRGHGRLTVEGDVIGTPNYMAPEQAAGRVQDIDARSDVYALGAVLYHLLAGDPPYDKVPDALLLKAIQEDDPEVLQSLRPGLEPDLEAITNKALSRERERRYQSALDLAHDLARFVDNEPVEARPATIVYRARKFVRRNRTKVTVVGVVAAAVFVVTSARGLEEAGKRRHVDGLVAAARAAAVESRVALYERALGVAPDDATVQALLQGARLQVERADAERRFEDQQRLAAERERALAAQQALARERAQAAESREVARLEGEARGRAQAEADARELLRRAEGARDPLEAIGFVSDALVLVRDGPELALEAGERKVDLALALADAALAEQQAGLADYWLREARKTPGAASRADVIERVVRAIAALESGRRLVEQARALTGEGSWLDARAALASAQAAGAAGDDVDQLAALIDARCADEAQRVCTDGRAALLEGRAAQALALARDALRFGAGDDAAALLEQAAARVAATASVEAHRLSSAHETRSRALEVLELAARTTAGTAFQGPLEAERRHRAAALTEPSSGLVYVPAVVALGVEACFIGRFEVTNDEFLSFVREGGYERPELFDEAARPHLASFVDATPGGGRPGPRGWVQGSYGDPALAARPVRGVTCWEARAYARWLSAGTRRRWRLATQAEWEAAAGWDPEAGRLRIYPWGDEYEPGRLSLGLDVPPPVRFGTDVSALGAHGAGAGVSEWVEGPGGRPLLKGAHFANDVLTARHLARVRVAGEPGLLPRASLLLRVGFRLVQEVAEP